MAGDPSPDEVARVGAGILDSRVLRAALEAQLFDALGLRSMMAPEICERLGLDPGSVHEFLDALVSLGLLRRIGSGPDDSEYRSTADPAVLHQILNGQ